MAPSIFNIITAHFTLTYKTYILLLIHRIEKPNIIEVHRSLQNMRSSCQPSGARNFEAPGFYFFWGGDFWIPAVMFVETSEKYSFLYDA